eukprot:scaffold102454_cov19-Tisochrysis_lutea.AAC.2
MHAREYPPLQASKLPDSALQHAAMTALNSTAPLEASTSTGADAAAGAAGAANSEGPVASTEKGNADAEGMDADFSDFAHFEQIVAGEPAPGAKDHVRTGACAKHKYDFAKDHVCTGACAKHKYNLAKDRVRIGVRAKHTH